MAACGAGGVAIIGGNSERWVVQASLIGFLIGVVNFGVDNFAATEFANFLRKQETELGFGNGIPLPLSMDLVGHFTVDINIYNPKSTHSQIGDIMRLRNR